MFFYRVIVSLGSFLVDVFWLDYIFQKGMFKCFLPKFAIFNIMATFQKLKEMSRKTNTQH